MAWKGTWNASKVIMAAIAAIKARRRLKVTHQESNARREQGRHVLGCPRPSAAAGVSQGLRAAATHGSPSFARRCRLLVLPAPPLAALARSLPLPLLQVGGTPGAAAAALGGGGLRPRAWGQACGGAQALGAGQLPLLHRGLPWEGRLRGRGRGQHPGGRGRGRREEQRCAGARCGAACGVRGHGCGTGGAAGCGQEAAPHAGLCGQRGRGGWPHPWLCLDQPWLCLDQPRLCLGCQGAGLPGGHRGKQLLALRNELCGRPGGQWGFGAKAHAAWAHACSCKQVSPWPTSTYVNIL